MSALIHRQTAFLAGVLALSMFAWAQTSPQTKAPDTKATISGTVLRAGSGQPLKRAKVSLRPSSQGQNAGQRAAALSAVAQQIQSIGAGGGIAQQLDQRLQVAMGGANTQAVTDDNGRFVFNGVEPGQYRLSVDRDGYIHQEFGQRSFSGPGTILNVVASQRLSNIDFQMAPAGTISGRIVNEDGEPVAGVQVQGFTYTYQQGKRTLTPSGQSVQTNDLGEYRLYWLTPADYYISATARRGLVVNVNPVVTQQATTQIVAGGGRGGARGARGAAAPAPAPTPPPPAPAVQGTPQAPAPQPDETYAPTYFPGTVSPESASPVSLPAAAEMRGIDFAIRPTPTTTVSGQVLVPISLGQAGTPAPPPQPAGGRGAQRGGPGFAGGRGAQINVMLNRTSSGGRNIGFGGGQNRTNVRQDGTFDISGVVPGSYNLVAVARQDGQQYSARLKLEVTDAGVNNVSLPLRAGIAVPGKIFLDGTPPQGFKVSQIRVNLMPTDDFQGGGGNGGAAQVADDNTFTLQNVSPMEYRVRVNGLPQGAYVMAGRIGNDDAVNQPFVIAGDQQVSLQLQIGFSAGHVQGTALDAKGTPYQGALAALIPDDPRRQRAELFFSVPTDQTGHFSFPNVPPGSYKLFAWEEIPTGAYQDPEFIRQFEDRGKPVKVDANSSVDADIPVILSHQ